MTEFADYAWKIDKDYTEYYDDIEPHPQGRHKIAPAFDVVKIEGPHNVDPNLLASLAKGGGQAFQLWDDDGLLYYSGRWIEGDDESNPLDDYGTPAAGATAMTVGNHQPFIS